ncbi:type II toxin-antitoxin system RelE/ParE family toxin [Parapedobacter soli]|uniref:type II toxin-antitoxin system RelE/ParE family toxin n=1 Tax=Parapedobacter soli TaxID=416955 RepID=UPI0021C7E2B3|nr:type II toxin-antitoxin system RelE/ParE family toxin [Parapedobacter soli]
MSNYRISKKAIEDLDNIWLYTQENWSIAQADRYYNLLIAEIEYIALNPNTGRDMRGIRAGYWSSQVKSHLIFYKVATDQTVEIVRILHQRMDVTRHL